MKRSLITLLSLFSLRADIVYESGDLIEFFGGTAPGSAYNNWVSHVTEGIANDGYNDYGPEWLDVQTNGFGHYKKLSELDIKVEFDSRNEKINYKIRDHSFKKVPIILIVGEKEKKENSVTIRELSVDKQKFLKLDKAIEYIKKKI